MIIKKHVYFPQRGWNFQIYLLHLDGRIKNEKDLKTGKFSLNKMAKDLHIYSVYMYIQSSRYVTRVEVF